MPVYENTSKYLEPAKYDELLTIHCTLKELPKVRIVFETEILNENDKIIHKGVTTLVFIKAETQKITTCPSVIIDKLSPFFS